MARFFSFQIFPMNGFRIEIKSSSNTTRSSHCAAEPFRVQWAPVAIVKWKASASIHLKIPNSPKPEKRSNMPKATKEKKKHNKPHRGEVKAKLRISLKTKGSVVCANLYSQYVNVNYSRKSMPCSYSPGRRRVRGKWQGWRSCCLLFILIESN